MTTRNSIPGPKRLLPRFKVPTAEQVVSAHEADAQARAALMADPRPPRLPVDLYMLRDLNAAVAAGAVRATIPHPVFSGGTPWEVARVEYDPAAGKPYTLTMTDGRVWEYQSCTIILEWRSV